MTTRPLYLVGPGGMMIYGHDFNKNVTEIFSPEAAGGQALIGAFNYTPYGSINYDERSTGINPFYFSSEYLDSELGLVYYNYRHYNSSDGRWINRDKINEIGGMNLYCFTWNEPVIRVDILGQAAEIEVLGHVCDECQKYIEQKKIDFAPSIKHLEEYGCEITIGCELFKPKTTPSKTVVTITEALTRRTDSRWWPFSSIKISLLFNCCYSNSYAYEKQDKRQDNFAHELQHAKDHCYGKRGSGCKGSVCTEIKAYAMGGCKGLKGQKLKECLRRSVPGSSISHCKNTEEIDKIFDEIYDDCIQDIPH